jgi:hypothetical protein
MSILKVQHLTRRTPSRIEIDDAIEIAEQSTSDRATQYPET